MPSPRPVPRSTSPSMKEHPAARSRGTATSSATLLLATGDRAGAAAAFDAALADDPRSHLALAGRARIAAAEGRLDDAIPDLDAAIAAVPLPEFLARRADLLELRAAPGDAARGADDRATVLAIAQLSGAAASTTGPCRCTCATTGIDPARALATRRVRDRGSQGCLRLRRARMGVARERPRGRRRRGPHHRPRGRDAGRVDPVPRRDGGRRCGGRVSSAGVARATRLRSIRRSTRSAWRVRGRPWSGCQ